MIRTLRFNNDTLYDELCKEASKKDLSVNDLIKINLGITKSNFCSNTIKLKYIDTKKVFYFFDSKSERNYYKFKSFNYKGKKPISITLINVVDNSKLELDYKSNCNTLITFNY